MYASLRDNKHQKSLLMHTFFNLFQKGKCKVRFARTLSCLMEKYYEEIKEYHKQDNTPNGYHGPRCKNNILHYLYPVFPPSLEKKYN